MERPEAGWEGWVVGGAFDDSPLVAKVAVAIELAAVIVRVQAFGRVCVLELPEGQVLGFEGRLETHVGVGVGGVLSDEPRLKAGGGVSGFRPEFVLDRLLWGWWEDGGRGGR